MYLFFKIKASVCTEAGIVQSVWWLTYGWDDRGIVVWFLAGTRDCVTAPECPDQPLGPPNLVLNGDWSLPGVKATRASVLLPSVAEVKNDGVIPVLRHRPSRCSQETTILLPAEQSSLPFSICCILLCAVFSYCRYKVQFFLQHILRTQRENRRVTIPNLNLGARWE